MSEVDWSVRNALRQGCRSSLCSVYAILNALNYLYDGIISGGDVKGLMKAAVRSLPVKQQKTILWEGIWPTQGLRMAQACCEYMRNELGLEVDAMMPYRRKHMTKAEFLSAIESFKPSRNTVLILWIDWKTKGDAHWTVFQDLTPTRLRLIDSDGLKPIPRSALRVDGERGVRINSGNTILIERRQPVH